MKIRVYLILSVLVLFFLLPVEPYFQQTKANAEITLRSQMSRYSSTPKKSKRKRSSRTYKRKGKGKRSRRGKVFSGKSKAFQKSLRSAIRSFGCTPGNIGFFGRRGNRSCHPQGLAGDLHSMKCGGTTYRAIRSSRKGSKFAALAAHLRSKGFFVMWHRCVKGARRNATTCHRDHIHASKCCHTRGGRAC